MKAVLLISHGSSSSKTKEEVVQLVDKLKEQSNIPIFEYAFLEIESPSIPEGIDLCMQKGAKEITILLNFLNSGKHVDEDIPEIIKTAREKYPEVTMQITHPVGQHARIVELFKEMIE